MNPSKRTNRCNRPYPRVGSILPFPQTFNYNRTILHPERHTIQPISATLLERYLQSVKEASDYTCEPAGILVYDEAKDLFRQIRQAPLSDKGMIGKFAWQF
jgi:hypothetical protein